MSDDPRREGLPREPPIGGAEASAHPGPNAALRAESVDDGTLGRRIVTGTVVQQGGQAAGLAVNLVTTTVLARTFSLAEFGVYGVVVSLATYFLFALGSAETAVIRVISGVSTQAERDRAYTAALTVYTGLGVVSGLAIGGGGQVLLDAFTIPDALMQQARLGVIAVGVMTAIGCPLRLYSDLLRGSHEFTKAGVSESVGWIALGSTQMLLLLVFDSPLWVVIGVGGSAVAFLGFAALVILRIARLPYHFRFAEWRVADVRELVATTSYMLAISASDVLISSLDRAVLAAYRPAATVGLYEGAVRVNNLVRLFTGSLSSTLLPVTSRLTKLGDRSRQHDLFVAGTRYMLAAVVPPTVTLMVLGDRVLAVWLGPKFATAGTAVTIFLAWWLLAPNSSVASALFVAESRFKRLFAYSWSIALINLGVSIALASQFGLNGVAAGTTIGYVSVFPFFMHFVFKANALSVREFIDHVWLPAYGTGAVLAVCLVLARQILVLDHLASLLAVAAVGVLGYWAVFAALWLSTDERRMFLGLIRPASPPGA